MRLRFRNRFSAASLVLFLLGTMFSTVLLGFSSQPVHAAGEVWTFRAGNPPTIVLSGSASGTLSCNQAGTTCRTTAAVRLSDGQVCNINVNSITKNTTSPNGGYTGRVSLENGVQCNSQSNVLGTTTIGIADPSGAGPGGGNAPGGAGGAQQIPAGCPGGPAGPPTPGTVCPEDDDTPSCEENGGDMSWMICPIIRTLDDVIEKLDREIQNLLEIPVSYLNDNLKATWGRLRNIAYIILVPVMLVMVIGTALGFEFFSAYTVKRAMPRLIFATVFIALSWNITYFMVEFFNAVGRGTMGLLTSSFAGAEDITLSSLLNPSGAEVGLGMFTGLIAAGAAVLTGFLSIGIILSYAFLAFLLLLVGFLILVFRQMFIILLVVLAPLAILAWIFPGNDRIWKLWWGTFTKLLMMFPIIAGMIAIGKVFAFLIDNTAGVAGFVHFASFLDPTNLFPFAQAAAPPPSTAFTFMKISAYLGPYALLYKVPAWVGGFFGALTNTFQDKTRGLMDRNKKFRQDKRSQLGERAKYNNRFRRAPILNRLNSAAAVTSNIGSAGFRPHRWGSNMRKAMGVNTQEEVEKNTKENRDYQQWRFNDDLNRIAYGTRNERELREALRNEVDANGNRVYTDDQVDTFASQVEGVRKQMSVAGFAQMTQEHAAVGGTAFRGISDVWEAVARASNGDESAAARMTASERKQGIQSGRVDQFAAGFGDTFGVVQDFMHQYRTGTGVASADPQERARARAAADRVIIRGAMDSSSAAQAIFGKPYSAAHLAQGHRERITEILQSIDSGQAIEIDGQTRVATERDFKQATAVAQGIHDTMAQASPQNARAFADNLYGQAINPSALGARGQAVLAPIISRAQPGGGGPGAGPVTSMNFREIFQHLQGEDREWDEMRRDYQSSLQMQIQQNQRQQAPAAAQGPGGGLPGQP